MPDAWGSGDVCTGPSRGVRPAPLPGSPQRGVRFGGSSRGNEVVELGSARRPSPPSAVFHVERHPRRPAVQAAGKARTGGLIRHQRHTPHIRRTPRAAHPDCAWTESRASRRPPPHRGTDAPPTDSGAARPLCPVLAVERNRSVARRRGHARRDATAAAPRLAARSPQVGTASSPPRRSPNPQRRAAPASARRPGRARLPPVEEPTLP